MSNRNDTINKAAPEDLPSMLSIYNLSVETETASFELDAVSPAHYQRWFEAHDERFAILVAKRNDMILGYASLSPFNPKPAYAITAELSVYIAETHRHRGLATSLISAVLAEARRGPLQTVVSLITAENTVSIHLHEKLGFRQVGTLHRCGVKFNRLLDVVIFEIDVSAPLTPEPSTRTNQGP